MFEVSNVQSKVNCGWVQLAPIVAVAARVDADDPSWPGIGRIVEGRIGLQQPRRFQRPQGASCRRR
jgi:hypothetical protein